MTVPALNSFSGTIHNWTPIPKWSPYTGYWWLQSTVDRIPETAVGWMLAQGWQVTSTYTEEDCGQTFYVMSRQSMNSWYILQSLLNEYTLAYNEGRAANSIRYNDIVNMWVNALSVVRSSLDELGDVSDRHMSLYVTQLDTIVTDMEADMGVATTDMETAGDAIADENTKFLTKVGTLEGIFDTHKDAAEDYLTGLGATELARINEQYNNLLSKTRQELVNRGMYSSDAFVSYQVQIERERNEQIAALNDRLNREKLANAHQLYTQNIAVRNNVLDGKAKYVALMLQNGTFLTETRQRIATSIMEARMRKAQGRMDIRDREEKLMAYQIDTHTNLAVGLWGFIERREDEYPSMESVTKLVAGLGDAGGGWVTP